MERRYVWANEQGAVAPSGTEPINFGAGTINGPESKERTRTKAKINKTPLKIKQYVSLVR